MTKNHAGKVILFVALALLLSLICVSAVAEGSTVIQDHEWDNGEFYDAANCSHGKRYVYTCKLCGEKKYVEVTAPDSDAHNWGEWKQTEAPTCTQAGLEVRVCKNVNHHKQERVVDPLGHKWDNGTITKKPTCTEPGVKTYTCQRNASHTYTEPVPATDHDWGDWVDVGLPTCTQPGQQKRTCRNDASHVQYRDVSATGHSWGPWKVITPATCTTDGKEERECNKCQKKEERAIKMLGHKWDKGTITKKPTLTEEGEILYTCQNDPTHTKTEKLARKSINGTLCGFGFRLRDSNLYPYSTDKWYMYTPFDASKEGTQTFEVVLSDSYIPGTITVTVSNGYLTVHEPTIKGGKMDYELKFFTVLGNISELSMFEPEQLMDKNMQFEYPYDMTEIFGEDRNLVLYLCSRVSAKWDDRWTYLQYNSKAHQAVLDSMRLLMQSDI